ncbi:1,6-anhydro-N-acetylmuramyl-L-alanine amidase AmpD [Noviherbaspirillum denitrificans]|uniref:1,6-anhydro-N-acetylmuramyl-L-alanine amidase AmpD n=1 Tax=Noviherbaspirillum denitrificans TaxID=1968433 RepID=A0A254T9S6_9BURK|nr:1,6-anhydro-N-acetylmuramyl-L-alanine amidase AmpD [Noviherbaspirillum denitrificans]OWW18927.1 N-acetyl-anhydromuranmyl-L-alanine amidase [Noviherbaspirillum denitrificans]
MMRFQLGDDGWAADVTRSPSPNFDARADGTPVSLLVVHNISLPPGEFGGNYIEDMFLNRLDCDAHPYFDQLRSLRVSAHFLIRRDGEVIQFVSANDRAWHAGLSNFCGRERCNDFSIGIELEGTDFEAFDPRQYESLVSLTLSLSARYPLADIAGHEHIAPGRKTDPGPFFDWPLFRKSLIQQGQAAQIAQIPSFPFMSI